MISFEWSHRFAVPYNLLDVTRGMWRRKKWKQWQRRAWNPVFAFVPSVANKMNMLEGPPVAAEYQFEIWNISYAEEAQYARELSWLHGLIQMWTELGVTADVHADAILWRDRRLPVKYRTGRKVEITFWADTVRYELRCRSEYG